MVYQRRVICKRSPGIARDARLWWVALARNLGRRNSHSKVPQMDAVTALTTRVSAVALGDPAPAGAALEAILTAGQRGPDHGRLRPFQFLLVRGEGRKRLGELWAESLRRRDPAAGAAVLDKEKGKALRAPLIIIAAARIQGSLKVPTIEQIIATGAAAQNILVATHALGFGGFWRTGPAAYDTEVKQALGLTAADSIVGYLYLGTHTAPPPPPKPISPGAVIEWPSR
jgi:nitroreductase